MPFFEGQMFPVLFIGQLWVLQLNEYETDPHFLQFFQSNTTVCLTIYVFSKIFECKHGNRSWADFTWYNELSDQWIFLKQNLCHKKPKVTRH